MIEAGVQASQPVPASVEEVLRDLPEWFGIQEALADYVDQATELPTYTAVVGGQVQGVCLVRRHSPYSAEVSLLAVRRSIHRQGLGRALMAAAEQGMKADSVGFISQDPGSHASVVGIRGHAQGLLRPGVPADRRVR